MLRAGPDPGSPERLLFRCNTMPATCDVDVVPDAFHFTVDHRRTRARFLASRACSGDLGTARRRNPVLAPHRQGWDHSRVPNAAKSSVAPPGLSAPLAAQFAITSHWQLNHRAPAAQSPLSHASL